MIKVTKDILTYCTCQRAWRLLVDVSSDSFDHGRSKFNVRNNVLERAGAVKITGYADGVIIEDYLGQKIDDIQSIQKYGVDISDIGSD